MYQSPYGAWLLVERIGLMLVALLAPEVILTVAFIEWIAAVIVTAAPSTSALLGIAVRLVFCKWGYEELGIVCVLCYRLL